MDITALVNKNNRWLNAKFAKVEVGAKVSVVLQLLADQFFHYLVVLDRDNTPLALLSTLEFLRRFEELKQSRHAEGFDPARLKLNDTFGTELFKPFYTVDGKDAGHSCPSDIDTKVARNILVMERGNISGVIAEEHFFEWARSLGR